MKALKRLKRKVLSNVNISVADIPPEITKDMLSAKLTDGRTLLHLAILLENENNVKVLVEAGSHVDARDDFQCTPIHYAMTFNMIDILIKNHANIEAKNCNGATFIRILASLEEIDLIILLLQKKIVLPEYVAKCIGLKKPAYLKNIIEELEHRAHKKCNRNFSYW